MTCVQVTGGQIYDPLHNRDGAVGDVWIRDGRVIEAPPVGTRADRVVDATGMIVMPGAIDIHCHIAGGKVNAARHLQPETRRPHRPRGDHPALRSGTLGNVPSSFTTGYLYAGLGYTTAFDAAVAPLFSRQVHEEFADIPLIDKGCFTLLGNHHYVLEQISRGQREQLRNFMGWMVEACRSYAIKVVNPGGIELWKQAGGNVHGLDDAVGPWGVTPRQIVRELAACADELKLPHPIHLHCNQLGVPGNSETTLATMRALEGFRAHLTHIQFHSYSGDPHDQSTMGSAVASLAEYVNEHPNLSVDVGQVMFGETTSMTADGAVGHFLHRLTGRKWINHDVELESGCGISPIEYKQTSLVHALQWAIGLEWFLLAADPWRIVLSTDHPNGASFAAYPQVIALLMEEHRRADYIKRLPPALLPFTQLPVLRREYSLREIAIITRAAPARLLGLKHKGHLGPGADGDLTLYQPQTDVAQMFSFPRLVLRRGEVVVDDGEIRNPVQGETLTSAPQFDADAVPHIRSWWEERSTVPFERFAIRPEQLPQ